MTVCLQILDLLKKYGDLFSLFILHLFRFGVNRIITMLRKSQWNLIKFAWLSNVHISHASDNESNKTCHIKPSFIQKRIEFAHFMFSRYFHLTCITDILPALYTPRSFSLLFHEVFFRNEERERDKIKASFYLIYHGHSI